MKSAPVSFYARALIGISLLLTLVGIVFIYSSSSVFALEKLGSAHYFLKRQVIYLLIALTGFFICTQLSFDDVEEYCSLFFLASLGCTLLTYVPGFSLRMHGSSRWISIAGFSFQPSELLIMATILLVARFLARRNQAVSLWDQAKLPFLGIVGFAFLVLLRQPDFGAVVTLFATLFVLVYVEELAFKQVAFIAGCTIPIVALLICMQPYRLQRVLNFLDPWKDPQGKGFQIIQSLIAIGSGKTWGLGIANSRQKFFYLPMQHTDFIFPIIAEETGFVGSCLLIGIFLFFCYYGLALAARIKRRFAFFTVLGFVVLINVRATINVMVATGMLPTKGLGLPFVSFGGSALIVLYCMLGLIMNAAHDVAVAKKA